MKKPGSGKNQKAPDHTFVTTAIDEINFLSILVQRLADRRYDAGYSREEVPKGWNCFDTSSVEAYASGSMAIGEGEKLVCFPFTSCFLFSCTKHDEGGYSLTWVQSLC